MSFLLFFHYFLHKMIKKDLQSLVNYYIIGCVNEKFIFEFVIAPVAQLDRVFGYEPKGQGFESLRAHHLIGK